MRVTSQNNTKNSNFYTQNYYLQWLLILQIQILIRIMSGSAEH